MPSRELRLGRTTWPDGRSSSLRRVVHVISDGQPPASAGEEDRGQPPPLDAGQASGAVADGLSGQGPTATGAAGSMQPAVRPAEPPAAPAPSRLPLYGSRREFRFPTSRPRAGGDDLDQDSAATLWSRGPAAAAAAELDQPASAEEELQTCEDSRPAAHEPELEELT
jgi:hypothetical protein